MVGNLIDLHCCFIYKNNIDKLEKLTNKKDSFGVL